MSEVIAEIVTINAITPHPNPVVERLEVAHVLGFECLVPKGRHKVGDVMLYVGPNMQLPPALAEQWGVAKYLSKGVRVKVVRLQGYPSQGLLVSPPDGVRVGENVAELLGITKYEPPVSNRGKIFGGKFSSSLPDLPQFRKYCDIENLRRINNVFTAEDAVHVSEKVHGSSARVGIVNGKLEVGSRNLRRRMPVKDVKCWRNVVYRLLGMRRRVTEPDDFKIANDWFWHPYSHAGVRDLMNSLREGTFLRKMQFHSRLGPEQFNATAFRDTPESWWTTFNKYATAESVIVYFESYGTGVQSMNYGETGLNCAAYDISVDGEFVNYNEFDAICSAFQIPTVPTEYIGKFDLQEVHRLANLPSVMSKVSQIREGVVVKCVIESKHPRFGRKIAKYISDDYIIGLTDDKITDKIELDA